MSYAEWFRYINDQSGPDKLALYSLSRKHGIHTSVFNKSYVWTTLMNHVNRTDDKIISLSGIDLVYLDATTYGIIRDIRTPHPQPELNPTLPKTPGQTSKCAGKVTCRSSSRSCKTSGNAVQVVAVEVMAEHLKHSANQGKRTMVYLLQM